MYVLGEDARPVTLYSDDLFEKGNNLDELSPYLEFPTTNDL
jgi:hypothetical protein